MSTYLVKSLNLTILTVSLTACDFITPIHMDLPAHLPEAKQKTVNNALPKANAPQTQVKPQQRQQLASLSGQEWQRFTPEQADQLKLPQNPVSINIDAMPLKDFVHLALAEILGLSFEVDPAVASREDPVTIHLTRPLKARALLDMIEETLRALDVFLAWSPQGLRVLPISKASTSMPQVLGENAQLLLKLGKTMTVIPLQYASPQEALSFVRHFMDTGQIGDVSANTRLNALVVVGMPERISAFKQAISLIDRPGFAQKRITLLRPVYWMAEPLAKTLTEFLKAENIPVNKSGGSPGDPAVSMSENGLNLLVVKPINAIAVVSPESSWVNLIDNWMQTLDTPDAIGGEENNTYVYFVKHGNAQGLGEVIGGILGESGSKTSAKDSSESPLAESQFSSLDSSPAGFDGKSTGAGSAVKREAKAKNNVNVVESKDLKVIVDSERNALVFVGSSRAYQAAYNLLQQLDRVPRQILIEATVADISHNNSQELGVEWQYKDTDGETTGVLGTLGGLGLAASSGGLSYALFNQSIGIEAKLRAMVKEGTAKVLSSPRLQAKDNEEAVIQVGTEVPVVASEISNAQAGVGTGGTPNLLRGFRYINTGVILKFTPTILEGGQVELKISQEVSEAGNSANNTPPIFKRQVDTVLVADSGQTIMIGGLITHNEGLDINKVPLLGDIPVLGQLFRYQTRSDRVTEMVVLITPHVLNSTADAAYLSDAFQRQLNWETK